MKKLLLILTVLIALLALTSCAEKGELGAKNNPVKMYFVPSMEASTIVTSGQAIADYLHEATGYYYEIKVPTSYAAVIEAMGTDQADIGWLATFAYILANSKFGAEVAMTTVRNGLKAYRGEFITYAGSGIETIEDIAGRTVGYTDAASTSGYIYPSAILKMKGIEPKRTRFVGSHPASVMAVYQKNIDVGCTFWSPPNKEGVPMDARQKILETYPDVFEKVKIVDFTDWIPNDTVTFRKEFPADMREKIVSALEKGFEDPKIKQMLFDLYQIDGLERATDADYDVVRKTLDTLGMNPSKML
ncbi:MAG: phosphate/phosphite/phosphonate ABC transporter substrate-binding protein [Candidatus Zophobacter franzmannii]|nr:phosphate/phosphite/phosphonate ABC transporter substrate-binding protein [Candidatus Zophobacter franzmannii]